MNKRILLALALGAMPATALLDACGDPGSSSPVLPTTDAAAKDGPIPDAAETPDSSPDVEAGSDCGKAPSLHPPKADGGIYCPFSGVDGGPNAYCPSTGQCCETPAGTSPSTCEPAKALPCPVDASVPWECEDPSDCAPGETCCGHSTDGTPTVIKSDACGYFLSHFGGTRCAASCGPNDVVVCETAAECALCTAVKTKGNEIGVCR